MQSLIKYSFLTIFKEYLRLTFMTLCTMNQNVNIVSFV